MPIYEYRCEACGHQEDHLQKISEAPLAKCPACGKKKYKKQLTAAGFQLKGSGWYATDFKSGAQKPEAKSDESKPEAKSEDSKTESKAEAKTESKAEAKTESKPEAKAGTKAEKKKSAASTPN